MVRVFMVTMVIGSRVTMGYHHPNHRVTGLSGHGSPWSQGYHHHGLGSYGYWVSGHGLQDHHGSQGYHGHRVTMGYHHHHQGYYGHRVTHHPGDRISHHPGYRVTITMVLGHYHHGLTMVGCCVWIPPTPHL